MRVTEPKVFLIGETRIIEAGLQAYLDDLGISDWESDASSDSEKLIETMGRLCYRSFRPGLNANVTRIREKNADYLANILEVRHGSVLEHAWVNFIFKDVSRVFTHELVRHRQGVAISQESLRFVRLDREIPIWLPTVIREDVESIRVFTAAVEEIEKRVQELYSHFEINDGNFARKKTLTSAIRRIAPGGLATSIGWSANFRALRHIIEMRTAAGAEEEIRLVFGKVAEIVRERYPNVFGDYRIEIEDRLPSYRTVNTKV